MLIGFTGAQSTGKTTLLNRMVNDTNYRKCSYVKEVTRKVARYGLNINELGDNETQLFILSEHLTNHHLKGCNVLDRCILDGWVYTHYLYEQGKVDKWVATYATNLLKVLSTKLDVVFYTDPTDVPLVDDNVRSVDRSFREGIIHKYNQLLFEENAPEEYVKSIRDKTVVLSGTIDQRYNILKDTLKNHDTTR